MKFGVIVADPPWKMQDQLKMSDVKRGADAHYQTISTDDMCRMGVADIVDPAGCVLCLWTVSSLLSDGLRIMESWGFTHKQTYIWVKTTDKSNATLAFGMGRLFRQCHELVLIGTRGKNVYKSLENKSQRSVTIAPNLRHSQKPETLQDSLDLMFPKAQKFEMFARRQRRGWFCAGNELQNGEDIRESIDNLKNDKNLDHYQWIEIDEDAWKAMETAADEYDRRTQRAIESDDDAWIYADD